MLERVCTLNLIFSLLLTTVFLSTLSAEERTETTKEDIVQQLDLLEEQINQLEQIYDQASQERSVEEQKLADLESKVAVSVNQLRKAETAVRQNQKRITALLAKQGTLLASKKSEEKIVAQHIQAAQRIGQDGPVKLILNQQDPNSLSRMSRYYKFMSEARIKQIEQYQRTLLALTETKQALDATTVSLESSRIQLQNQSEQLDQARQERQGILHEVLQKMQSTHTTKQKLTLDRDNLESVLARLENSVLTLPTPDQLQPLSERKGQLQMPSQGRISQYFGQARVKDKVYWKGLLIDAPTGTPVHSIHYGRVVFADWLRGFGLLLSLIHI